ncbi:unnamed protein product [Rhodiola kirilowii]
MANLRTAMDASFWDLDVSSPLNLDGIVKSVPGDSVPLDGARASRVVRVQQLLVMKKGFPFGLVPSCAPTCEKELGSFALQKLLLRPTFPNGWLGLVGQFRPKKLISSIKADAARAKDGGLPIFKDMAKRILDKSLYSLGLCSEVSLTDSSSILLTAEAHGERTKRRTKATFYQQLPHHDLTVEAAWPELFVDGSGGYWDMPGSHSLNLASLNPEPGLQYRVGLHKNSGFPKAVNTVAATNQVPRALMSEVCANAALSFEKIHDFWRRKERKEDTVIKTEKGWFWRHSYDERLKEPHSAISGIIGGTFAAAFGGKGGVSSITAADGIGITSGKSSVTADLFGSVCYTFQHGQFRERYNDLTRLDARIDVKSATALAKRVINSLGNSPVTGMQNNLSSPKLNFIFQQQVVGPLAFRVDTKFALDSSLRKPNPEDLIYSLTYSLKLLKSGKVVAWYSPKRKEGMIELRLFEF